MIIIDSPNELFMETDRSYYFKVLGMNYISLLNLEVISSNSNTYSDLKKTEKTY